MSTDDVAAGISVRPYTHADAAMWDRLVEHSLAGTFLHTRRFLGYHGDRFRDQSLVIRNGDALLGLLPAATDPGTPDRVISHPGITYGGFLHDGGLRGQAMITALTLACAHYAAQGFSHFRYKPVPAIYHRSPAQDDLYALFRAGAVLYRQDLSVAIDLDHRLKLSSRRSRSLKKAAQAQIQVDEGAAYLPQVWAVLEDILHRRHGAKPVHTLAEITLCQTLFPNQIRVVVGHRQGQVLAALVLFETAMTTHTQYICSSDQGLEVNALDAVIEQVIHGAKASGRRYVNFGVCNEEEGRILNEGLYRFKAEFGGSGIVHSFYDIPL